MSYTGTLYTIPYTHIQGYTRLDTAINSSTGLYKAKAAIQRYMQLYRAMYSYTRLYTAIHCYTQLYTAIHSYTRLYTAIQGYTQL